MKKSLLVRGFFVAPGGAAKRAVVFASVVLVTGELAVFTERGEVKVVAVAVETIFGEILIVFGAIFGAEFLSFGPGASLDLEKFDVGMVICFAN